jgi:TetR/AcrR family transcriptional repressor of nem operon
MDRKPKRLKKTRDLEKTRAAILEAAFLLVLKNGFQGVSVDDIVEETRFTKGAFYHLFPTKLDLGYALVDEVIRPLIIHRWIAPLEDFENPLGGILSQMEKLIGGESPALLKLGCPLNNLVQEMAPLDPGFRKRLRSALDLWVNETERHLARAKAGGFLKKSVNTKEAAHFIVMAHEGFYGMIKGLGNAEAFEELFSSLKIYFGAISTDAIPTR